MKTQMRFQKYICLVMLLVGALALAYAFFYATGGLSELGYAEKNGFTQEGLLVYGIEIAEGKYGGELYTDIQSFNNLLMYCGIAMILFAVLLYITACNKRRNYYVTNYVATGLCAGGNIVISLVLIILNAIWKGRFLNIDFDAWKEFKAVGEILAEFGGASGFEHYSESTVWFDIGFGVYAIVIIASVLLILNLVWKVLLMKGEKKLLDASATIKEGAAV